MSELSITRKEVKKGINLSLADAIMFFVGVCAGIHSQNLLVELLSFCVLGYFFQKSLQQFYEFLAGFLLCSSLSGMLNVYQQFLLVMFFGLLVLFVRVIHASMFHAMPWILLMTGLLIALVSTSNFLTAFKAGIFAFVLMKMCSNEKILIQKEFRVSEMILSVLTLLTLIWVKPFISVQQYILMNAFVMCAAALYFDGGNAAAVFGLLILAGSNVPDLLNWLFPSAVLYFLRSMKSALLVVYPILCMVLHEHLFSGVAALFLISLIHCLPDRKDLVFLEQDNEENLLKARLRNKERLLQHHLHQFSQIFDLIADYYEESFKSEVEFLKGMSSSMSHLALNMKQCALSQEDEAYRIAELLKGYHYDISKVYVSYGDAGNLHVRILMNECNPKDIEDVILPLLQMNIDQHLKVVSCRKAQKFSGMLRIDLAGQIPYGFKAKSYRVLNEEKISGDTCGIFQHQHHTVCTISDGMGVGENAQKTSGFVTCLTQRLLSCGMPIERIVRCINELCALNEKEHFATLDFLCFDALNHRAVMAKNGAAPSYLIRGKEVLKIEGHSLPLGIVERISADCYQVEVKRKDIFLMCSDGCDEAMIQQWLECPDAEKLRKSVVKTLKECEKRDDISVIVAEIV